MSLLLVGPYTQLTPPVQRGYGTPFCRRQTGRWSPTNGWTLDQDFNCLGPFAMATMQSLANQYGAAGIEYEVSIQNGIATMRTVDTTGNVTIDVWEINASQVSSSVLENPMIVAAVSANDLKVISRAYLDGSDLPTALAKVNGDTSPAGSYTLPDVSGSSVTHRLWDKIKNGQDATYFHDQYTLRHTTNASNRGYYNVADWNVNHIFTQSQLYSEITNGGYWIFPAPNEIIGALNVIFSGLGTAPSNYVKGALKGGSSRVTAANNRVNITTEYKMAIIDTDNYAAAV